MELRRDEDIVARFRDISGQPPLRRAIRTLRLAQSMPHSVLYEDRRFPAYALVLAVIADLCYHLGGKYHVLNMSLPNVRAHRSPLRMANAGVSG